MAVHIPNAPLKTLFFGHLILTVWAGQGAWLCTTYLFYNGIFLLTILWSLHQRDSEEGPFMAVCIDVILILLDIISIAISWPIIWTSRMKFAAVSAFLNLGLRPLSCFLLYRLVQDRAGTYGNFVLPTGLGGLFSGSGRTPYEDIDQPNQQVPPSTSDMISGSPDNLFAT